MTTALLVSVNGCQTAPPDSEPAPQTPTIKTEPASESGTTVDTVAAIGQIIAGINFKPAVSIFKKTVTKNESDKQNHATNTKQESSQAPIFGIENSYTQGAEPIEPSKVSATQRYVLFEQSKINEDSNEPHPRKWPVAQFMCSKVQFLLKSA